MKGTVSLELLIVAVALMGVLIVSAEYYDKALDVFSRGVAEKKAEHVARSFRSILSACTPSTITVSFPYVVEVDCAGRAVIVDGVRKEIPACTGGGTGYTFEVTNCHVSAQT